MYYNTVIQQGFIPMINRDIYNVMLKCIWNALIVNTKILSINDLKEITLEHQICILKWFLKTYETL